ncbi:nucleoside transporter-domain-containing protein [Terfezia claveryi]|nr:nucleoside transporter-domain-containing protein [Terfezia claveryi]
METINRLVRPRTQSYEPLPEQSETTQERRRDEDGGSSVKAKRETSTFEYVVFALVGVAMLWSWNMFMACATYFQRRFATSPYILDNFQSLILLVSTVTNLASVVYLSLAESSQSKTDYPGRILRSLKINATAFTLLALSTLIWRSAGPAVYLVFTLFNVFLSSLASGMMQNGAFSWVNRFDAINTQAMMVGQGIAGVLPAIAQIMSILLVPPMEPDNSVVADELPTVSPLSAFFYFITATLVSAIAYVAIAALKRRQESQIENPGDIIDTEDETYDNAALNGDISFWVLLGKLKYVAFSVFFTFAVTMIFPVYTQAIVSVRPVETQSRCFQPDVFIPLSFMIWNTGDLAGRVICAYPFFRVYCPKLLAILSMGRLVFIPLYLMCNIKGQGAYLNSDSMYWLIQMAFGISNGWLGANNLMAAPDMVTESERAAAGGFMSMWLVGGLAAGSVLSFFVM